MDARIGALVATPGALYEFASTAWHINPDHLTKAQAWEAEAVRKLANWQFVGEETRPAFNSRTAMQIRAAFARIRKLRIHERILKSYDRRTGELARREGGSSQDYYARCIVYRSEQWWKKGQAGNQSRSARALGTG